MALLESCRGEIFEFNGLNLLADFLFESPSDYESNETELNACERVIIKFISIIIIILTLKKTIGFTKNSNCNK